MTPEELQHLRALCEKATPGPWRWGDWGATFGTVERRDCMLTLERNMTRLDDPTPYKTTRADGRYQVLTLEASDAFGTNGAGDAAFIAAARSALPRLLDECERLRVEADADVANLREGHCLAVIPETFIACGEGGNYCSEACRLRKLLAEACRFGSEMIDLAAETEHEDEIEEYRGIVERWRREGGVE